MYMCQIYWMNFVCVKNEIRCTAHWTDSQSARESVSEAIKQANKQTTLYNKQQHTHHHNENIRVLPSCVSLNDVTSSTTNTNTHTHRRMQREWQREREWESSKRTIAPLNRLPTWVTPLGALEGPIIIREFAQLRIYIYIYIYICDVLLLLLFSFLFSLLLLVVFCCFCCFCYAC